MARAMQSRLDVSLFFSSNLTTLAAHTPRPTETNLFFGVLS